MSIRRRGRGLIIRRAIRAIVTKALLALATDFAAIYAKTGRPRSRRSACCALHRKKAPDCAKRFGYKVSKID